MQNSQLIATSGLNCYEWYRFVLKALGGSGGGGGGKKNLDPVGNGGVSQSSLVSGLSDIDNGNLTATPSPYADSALLDMVIVGCPCPKMLIICYSCRFV